jgi:hypothetical protein
MEKEIDPFYILNELKSLKAHIEQEHLDTAEIEVNQLIDTFQAECDARHRKYVETAQRHLDQIDEMIKKDRNQQEKN